MKRAALYVRVSTQEQKKHGLSVDSQITALQKYCDENNLDVVGIYNDAGISARKPYSKRPALIRLLEDCEHGKIDQILFTRLDRWFRSVSGYHEVQSRLDACNVSWRTIWEDYQTETSDGIFKVNIMLSIAQAEADRTSEKIKSVNEYRRDNGWYVGSAPTGYKIDGNYLVKDESMREAVEGLFNTYLATYSTSAARMEFIRISGKQISLRQAKGMLINPSYTGDAHGSVCDPYITKDQHDEIMNIRASRVRKPKNPGTVYLFSGLCKCGECGGSCPAKTRRFRNTDKNGVVNEGTSHFYRCPKKVYKYDCKGSMMSEHRIEAYLLSELDKLIGEYNVRIEEQKKSNHAKEIENLKARLSRIKDLYEDGDITRDEYRTKRDAYNKSIAELEKIDSVAEYGFVELPEDWKEMYNDLTPDNKRLFWRKTIKKIVLNRKDKGGVPEVYFN